MLITTNEKLKLIVEAMDKILDKEMLKKGRRIHGLYSMDDPNIEDADCSDCKETIYESDNIKIVFCPHWGYFRSYGLSPLEFLELKHWYLWKREAAWQKREEERK